MSATRADGLREALAGERCWDEALEATYQARGEPLADAILQDREELLALAGFIAERNIRSYLEIGLWTGRLLCALHRVFRFERVAGCDHGWAQRQGLPLHLPPDAAFYAGDSDSEGFLRWREALGPIDLVLIDANHRYGAVKRDFELNRRFPHRFLALHDILGRDRATAGVGRLWWELDGHKRALIRPPDAPGFGRAMGIGIWSEHEAL